MDEFGRDVLTSYPKESTLDRTKLLNVGDDLSCDIDWYGEGVSSIVACLRVDHGVDPDQFACGIDEGSSAIAWIDSSVSLDEGTYFQLITCRGR